MPYLVNILKPVAAASPFKTRGSFERDNVGTLTSTAYTTKPETAKAVTLFVLDPFPADRDPLSTACAHRITSWDGEGEVVFPLANLTTVAVVQVTYPDLAYLCKISDREMRVLKDSEGDLVKEYNRRMGPTK